MHVAGRPFAVEEVHWLEDGQAGQQAALDFTELLPNDFSEAVGKVVVHVDTLSTVETRCGPGQHDLLLRLFAAYQVRYGMNRRAAHAGRLRDEIRPEILRLSQAPRRRSPKVGRNEPCPCGSGKKYKRCCGR